MSKSAPEQYPLPAPVTTITRASGSALARRMACSTSAPMRSVQAFRRSGRFRVISATPSVTE